MSRRARAWVAGCVRAVGLVRLVAAGWVWWLLVVNRLLVGLGGVIACRCASDLYCYPAALLLSGVWF